MTPVRARPGRARKRPPGVRVNPGAIIPERIVDTRNDTPGDVHATRYGLLTIAIDATEATV
ncbi:hypothetical protein RW1_080_00050 [Rhodococcus wratislaviensis NBRC 100605]|uniref:Uncharacterized protein n=1 Tax=Rhodococcus wratislaviensis NBRC 100605 TaxID=1219028 RepID=X0Q0D6_RHOWR|nr:hypothetical protein RW1_080_00050 [Rhodococcus wratislaviensis NBRC 100605]